MMCILIYLKYILNPTHTILLFSRFPYPNPNYQELDRAKEEILLGDQISMLRDKLERMEKQTQQ